MQTLLISNKGEVAATGCENVCKIESFLLQIWRTMLPVCSAEQQHGNCIQLFFLCVNGNNHVCMTPFFSCALDHWDAQEVQELRWVVGYFCVGCDVLWNEYYALNCVGNGHSCTFIRIPLTK